MLGTEDQSEHRALWNLFCLLERQLIPIFGSNFRELLSTARDSLRDRRGTDSGADQIVGRLVFGLHPDAIAFLANEWRKLPRDMPEENIQQWADIVLLAMSALHNTRIEYTAKATGNGYDLGESPTETEGTIEHSS